MAARLPRHLLLAEDVDLMAALYSRSFTDAGWTVFRARTGAEALSAIGEGSHDAIVLDLTLPDMTGLEVLSALAATPVSAIPPVVVLTNTDDAHTLNAARYAGAASVLVKSAVAPEDVVQTVARLADAR